MNKKIMMKMMVMMLVIVLALVGCGNKEEAKNEADKERLDEIALEIEALYNEDQDDLAEGVDEEMLEDTFALLKEEGNLDEDLSEENEAYFTEIKKLHEEAVTMFNFETLVIELVDEDGEVDEQELELVQGQLSSFEDKETFFNRLTAVVEEIVEELEAKLALEEQISETEKAINKLYKDDKLKKDVSKDDYKKVEKLVKAINDKDASLEFEKRLKKLDKDMKALAKKKEEKRLAEEKKKEEAKRQAEAQAQQQSSQSSSTSQSTKSNTQSNTKSNTQTASKSSGDKGSSNKSTAGSNNQSKPKQQSKPKEQPKKEQPKKEREIVMFPASSIGNSGKEFATNAEAEAWANKVWKDPNSKWYSYNGWKTNAIFYGYYDESGRGVPTKTTYTVIFF